MPRVKLAPGLWGALIQRGDARRKCTAKPRIIWAR